MIVQVEIDDIAQHRQLTPDRQRCEENRIDVELTLHGKEDEQRRPSAEEDAEHHDHVSQQMQITTADLSRPIVVRRIVRTGSRVLHATGR